MSFLDFINTHKERIFLKTVSFFGSFPEAASTEQKDLHKELSALRVSLENVAIVAPGANISQVQWKV